MSQQGELLVLHGELIAPSELASLSEPVSLSELRLHPVARQGSVPVPEQPTGSSENELLNVIEQPADKERVEITQDRMVKRTIAAILTDRPKPT